MHNRYCLALIASMACSLHLLAFADPDLAHAKNCMSCHNLDRKVVGPAFKDVAQKYKADKDATSRLAAKIIKGGGGVWGVGVMPANPQVSDAEAHKLAAWVLSQK